MCQNPFGGHGRLDKLPDDLIGDAEPGPAAMFRMTILDALQSYQFFGLGRNGTTAEEFMFSHDYFFRVTDNPATWPADRVMKVTVCDGGVRTKRAIQYIDLDDATMRAGTFPAHYEVAGFHRHMTIDTFRRRLLEKRRRIVDDNYEQVRDYLRALRRQAAARREFLKAGVIPGAKIIETLVEPTPEGLAALLYPVRPIAVTPSKLFAMPPRIRGRRSWAA